MDGVKIPTSKTEIDYAAENAVRVIGAAAEGAARVVASAAEAAAKVVASAAAESVKVVNEKGANDHDLLIRLSTQMEGLQASIKGISDNSNADIKDHETRIFALETTKGTQTLLISIGTGFLTLLIGIMLFHLFKM